MAIDVVSVSPAKNGDSVVELRVPSSCADLGDNISRQSSHHRTPVDLVCVVDESYSMSKPATLNNVSSTEDNGICLADIVRHALKTIIGVLGPNDRLAIVGFSSKARIVTELTPMCNAGKEAANAGADQLGPKLATNLWDGLELGLNILKDSLKSETNSINARMLQDTTHRHQSLMLLTDGVPNCRPNNMTDEVSGLREYLQRHPTIAQRVTINTFGFGYDLNSELLNSLSTCGSGLYSFIPDASFVGTVFINSLANVLSTVATSLSIEICGAKVIEWIGYNVSNSKAENRSTVRIGSIQRNQSRTAIVRIKNTTRLKYRGKSVTAVLRYIPWNSSTFQTRSVQIDCSRVFHSTSFHTELLRLSLTDTILRAYKRAIHCIETKKTNDKFSLHEAYDLLNYFAQKMISTGVTGYGEDNAHAISMLDDLNGQVKEALSRPDYFERWGQHYILSLAQSHQLQQCSNFKDPGLQHYGGRMFQSIRDKAEDLFLRLPPPTPTRQYNAKSTTANASENTTMRQYHCATNGCFRGDGVVKMAGGCCKRVDKIQKNDIVITPAGPTRVKCVVKFESATGNEDLVKLGTGLYITSYHPVRSAHGEWVFPCSLAQATTVPCTAVYNFVLERGHELTISGVNCVTLAHGFTDNTVIYHPFFGTSQVLNQLRKLKGWSTGRIVFPPNSLLKDADTGLTAGYLLRSEQNSKVYASVAIMKDRQHS